MTRPIRRGKPWPPCNGKLSRFATERGMMSKFYRHFCGRWFANRNVWFGVRP